MVCRYRFPACPVRAVIHKVSISYFTQCRFSIQYLRWPQYIYYIVGDWCSYGPSQLLHANLHQLARCGRSSSVQVHLHSPPMSPQQRATVPDRLLCRCLGYRWSSATVLSTPTPAGCTAPSTTLSRRAFSVTGPTVWNVLPVKLRDETENTFRQSLKPLLFRQY